jgi:putative membrane protein
MNEILTIAGLDLSVFMNVILYSFVGFVMLIIAMYIFNKITPYDEFDEIVRGGPDAKGNKAVAFDYAGKIISIAKIIATAILTCKSVIAVIVWGFIGIAMLTIAFEIFEYGMKDNKHEELKAGKEARGIFTCAISLSIMLIVTAIIS